jgi:hypothetical protein
VLNIVAKSAGAAGNSVATTTTNAAVAATGSFTLATNVVATDTVTIDEAVYTFVSSVTDVAASATLTAADVPTDGDVVSIDGTDYTFVDSLTDVAASATLTAADVPTDGDVVSIDGTDYTFVDSLTDVAASATLTFGANAGEGKIVTIGSKVYTFQETLTDVDGNVHIGDTAAESLDNLIAAITLGAGSGTAYATSMTEHDSVTAAAGDDDTMVATAKTAGAAGNEIAVSTDVATASWGESVTALSGGETNDVANNVMIAILAASCLDNLIAAIGAGVGEGSTYGTGTLEHDSVTAAAGDGATMVVTAATAGAAGNEIEVSTTGADLSWGESVTALSGGETNDVANNVIIGVSASASLDNLIAAIGAGVGEGSTYGTGTLEHDSVTAAAGDDDTMVVTAATAGEDGNEIEVSTTGADLSWGEDVTTLSGGETNNVAGNVVRGVDAATSIANLVAAINASAGGGTTYAAATTEHATVSAVASTVHANLSADTAGYDGNSIATTTTSTHGSCAAATLLGGGEIEFGGDVLSGGSDGTVTTKAFGTGAGVHGTVVLPADIEVAAGE